MTLVVALAVSAAVTPSVRRLAHRLRLLAHPSADRWHRKPVALLGGYAMFVACLAAIAATTPVGPILPLFAGASLMFALGALDDAFHFRAVTKLVAQTAIAALILWLAPHVAITGHAAIDLPLSLLWIVGITNAFNLLDNMDGLSAGIAVIAGIFYLGILGDGGVTPTATGVAAFTGAVLGFLIYNFRPATIFMGDSGSLFVGSFLATAALYIAPELESRLAPVAAIPLFILLVPIFDTVFVTITRRLAGRNPMVGGRDHLSHRLVALGMDERTAVALLYLLSTVGGGIAVSLLHVHFGVASTLIAAYLILMAVIGIVLGHVELSAEPGRDAAAPLLAEVGYRNRTYEVMLDTALAALAYYAAFQVRFRGPEVAHFLPYFAASFPLVLGCQIGGLALAGKYRHKWRSFGAPELFSILKGSILGVGGSILVMLYLFRFEGFSRLVFAIDAGLLFVFVIGNRVGITVLDDYLRTQRTRGRPVVIYGAGRRGMLMVRELLDNRTLQLVPVGFIDDHLGRRRMKVEGVPVLGTFEDLSSIIERHAVAEVVVSIHDLDRARLAALAALCRARGVSVRSMRFDLVEIGPVPHVRHDSQAG